MNRKYLRALALWPAFIVVAIMNGLFRESVLNRFAGASAGHILSSVMLALLVIVVTFLFMRRPVAEHTTRELWIVGGMWVVLTIAFEFLFGRYVTRSSWDSLLHEYNILAGRAWVLVLAAVAVAPRLTKAFILRRKEF